VFRVAHELGKTAEEINTAMTHRELCEWMEYLEWADAKIEKADYYGAYTIAALQGGRIDQYLMSRTNRIIDMSTDQLAAALKASTENG
jgi:hypothetical protein